MNSKKQFVQKNLIGVDLLLQIEKKGGCFNFAVERKLWDCCNGAFFLGAVILAFLILCYTRDVKCIFVCCAILLYYFGTSLRKESLTVISSLGYQISSKYVLGHKTVFIPWKQVQRIFINEVIVRHRVIHVLTLLTKDQEKEQLIPLFLGLEPRLKHLEIIYKHLKSASS